MTAEKDATVHLLPPNGSLVYPCCGRAMFEVPRTNRITWDRAQVTCSIPPG